MEVYKAYLGATTFNPLETLEAAIDVFKNTKAVVQPAEIDKGNNRYMTNSATSIENLLANAGVPSNIVPMATAQVMYETGGLTSRVSKADGNLSGIKWLNKPYQKATRGTKSPEGNYYAKFASFEDWANDYKRILSIGGANAPINATGLQDYVNRLYHNHYFTSAPSVYYAGLAAIMKKTGTLQQQQAQQLAPSIEDAHQNWWQKLPTWGKVGVGAGAALVAYKVLFDN
jgi:hypothetical protein